MWDGPLEKISDCKFRIPKSYKKGMLVDGLIYSDDNMIEDVKRDKAIEQVVNVSFLPGIVKSSFAMPDIHWGYGFCIGGVAATDPENGGVISPGGVGYDINCGVRLVKTNLEFNDIKNNVSKIVNTLYNEVPSGVGSKGDIRVSVSEVKKILIQGAKWAVSKGYGVKDDLEYCEEKGAIEGANPDMVSERAYQRGRPQSGTLGSGNHFVEVQVIKEIFDVDIAEKLDLKLGQIMVMIHSGSRGLGYQVCDDYLREMGRCVNKYGIDIPDRQLACTPIKSREGQEYIGAMRAAANYAWANRQVLMYLVRQCFEKIFRRGWQSMGMDLIYDVAHNIAKFEKHKVDDEIKTLCVHRKGATRAFGPGNKELPNKYFDIGQPVIIPGDMGTSSYLLVGTKKAEEDTFASTCHGAGRMMSRHEAIRKVDFDKLMRDLGKKGIQVRAAGKRTIVEEAPLAYKNVNHVVNIVHQAGLSKKICKMSPICVVKG